MRAIIPPDMSDAAAAACMSPAVAAGDFVFLTGMTGSEPDGRMPDDPEKQFRNVFAKIEHVLSGARLDLSSVVEMTGYHVALREHFPLFDQIRRELFKNPYPVWTAVEVADLRRPGALVEVRAVAARTAHAGEAQ